LSVQTNLLGALALAFFLCGYSIVHGQPSAPCNSPPGGRISCEASQAAFCEVTSGGQVEGACKTPPKGMTKVEFHAWLLSFVLRREVSVKDISQSEYQRILSEQRIEVRGRQVTFSPPEILE
jgi:hypothetical protein